MVAGKQFYMTASTAQEHTNKLWENEGTFSKINIMRRSKHYLTSSLGWFFIMILYFCINCHCRLFFEVPVFWCGGNGVAAGCKLLLFRPVFLGNAGGSTIQVLKIQDHTAQFLFTYQLYTRLKINCICYSFTQNNVLVKCRVFLYPFPIPISKNEYLHSTT